METRRAKAGDPELTNAGTWGGCLCGGAAPGFPEPIWGNECALPYGSVAPFSSRVFEPLMGFANGRSLGRVLRLIAAGKVGMGAR